MHTDNVRWTEYVRLQRRLAECPRADDRTAGYEKALDALLLDDGSYREAPRPDDIDRIRANVERNERRRRSLMKREACGLQDHERVNVDTGPVAAIHARIELRRILQVARPTEIPLILCLAGAEGTVATAPKPASFRKRLERLRKRLAA